VRVFQSGRIELSILRYSIEDRVPALALTCEPGTQETFFDGEREKRGKET
jgi:hypothetical protein